MATPDDAVTAILTEHLGYTPITLIDDIINAMNALLYQGVSSVETFLLNSSPSTLGFPSSPSSPESLPPAAEKEILEGTHSLETLLESTVDRNFDKLEIFVLRNILTVPEPVKDWVRLGHYENLNFEPNADAPTEASLRELQAKYRATLHLQALLQREQSRNAATIAQLNSLLSPPEGATSSHSFLISGPTAAAGAVSQASQAPLTETARFALSQLPHLKSLLATLRPKLDAPLPDSSEAVDERRVYIESQTRRHLEVTKGVELLGDGTIRDGEWADGGPRLTGEKVKQLEDVVRGLQGDEEA